MNSFVTKWKFISSKEMVLDFLLFFLFLFHFSSNSSLLNLIQTNVSFETLPSVHF